MGELTEHWLNLRSASPSHQRVRLVALAGAVLFALSLVAADAAGPVAWVGTVVLGALVVYQPNGAMPAVFILWAVAAWWAGVDATWHWALLPAAWSLLLVHASAALAASVPPQATLPRAVVLRYAVRTAVVAALTLLVWGLAGVLAGAPSLDGPLPAIAALALLAAGLVGYVVLRQRWRADGGVS